MQHEFSQEEIGVEEDQDNQIRLRALVCMSTFEVAFVRFVSMQLDRRYNSSNLKRSTKVEESDILSKDMEEKAINHKVVEQLETWRERYRWCVQASEACPVW